MKANTLLPVSPAPTSMGDLNESIKMALADSEEKFPEYFPAVPVAFSLTRLKDGKVLEVNDSYCRATGYTREEIIGRTIHDL